MIQHLINGESVDSKDRFQTINPATQEPIAEVAAGEEREIALAVEAAKEAFPKWAGMAAKQTTEEPEDRRNEDPGCCRYGHAFNRARGHIRLRSLRLK